MKLADGSIGREKEESLATLHQLCRIDRDHHPRLASEHSRLVGRLYCMSTSTILDARGFFGS